jgi:hypothetical protein
MSSLFFAITKFLDIRCVNAVRLCAEVKYASRLVTSDKVLSFNRKLSDVNNLLVEYGKRVNTYVDYQLYILVRIIQFQTL